jgi:fluoride exporter
MTSVVGYCPSDWMIPAGGRRFRRCLTPVTSAELDSPIRRLQPRTRVRVRLLLAIFVGGAVGALLRAGLEEAFPASGHDWPWATFLVNVLGAALLAYFATRLQERLPPSTYPRPFLGTGVCGALTTFSTLQIEVIELCRNGHAILGVGYLVASVILGLVVVQVATALVRRVPAR